MSSNSMKSFKNRMLAQPLVKRVSLTLSEGREEESQPRTSTTRSTNVALPVSFTTASASSTYSINRQVYDIIIALKSQEEALTRADIHRKTLIDIDDPRNKELLEYLKTNEKIEYDPVLHTFKFKPTYNIKNKEDLLRFLESQRMMGGVEVKELKEGFPEIVTAANELEQEGKIFVTRNLRDELPRVVFYCNAHTYTPISQEFQDLWHSIKVPDTRESLEAELEKCGLKGISVIGDGLPTKNAGEDGNGGKRSRVKKRLRLTNTHLEGIDLMSKDFVFKTSSTTSSTSDLLKR